MYAGTYLGVCKVPSNFEVVNQLHHEFVAWQHAGVRVDGCRGQLHGGNGDRRVVLALKRSDESDVQLSPVVGLSVHTAAKPHQQKNYYLWSHFLCLQDAVQPCSSSHGKKKENLGCALVTEQLLLLTCNK